MAKDSEKRNQDLEPIDLQQEAKLEVTYTDLSGKTGFALLLYIDLPPGVRYDTALPWAARTFCSPQHTLQGKHGEKGQEEGKEAGRRLVSAVSVVFLAFTTPAVLN